MDIQEKILIVEDDNDINHLLAEFFKQEGYAVCQAYSGSEARYYLDQSISLILLDLMLPGLSGEELLKEIRQKLNIPVLIISGKVDVEDKIRLLDLGADDYIIKPFQEKEILARARRALEKAKLYTDSLQNTDELYYKKLVLNSKKHTVFWESSPIQLTQTEFELLRLFITKPEQVFSRDELYRSIWDADYVGDDNAITVHISNLRQKLKKSSGEELIVTIWGIGYKLVE